MNNFIDNLAEKLTPLAPDFYRLINQKVLETLIL